ncbi:calcium:proton antiporter [uncultured Thiodictyon sp.]|uniref:calcium:proton antiporter n=1 Tax=uncultured Thiodictyon sp. TaxID=1846217 RepID=UPI0025E720B5|nr:calcium:proton antiporter [uncultured Thiodictyon sp.]
MNRNHQDPALQGARPATTWTRWRPEWPLPLALATAAVFLVFGNTWLNDPTAPLRLTAFFTWLFVTILLAAMRVVYHAECLAIRFGEPYGTLILTLSVTSIEVLMIAALMLHGDNNPTLARDSMFAVVMIVLNGLVGLALILGALRYHEQSYNLQGTRAYLSVIVPLAVLSLVLPTVTVSTPEPTLNAFQSVFLLLISLALYGTFLMIQTRRHRSYFSDDGDRGSDEGADAVGDHPVPDSPYRHSALLLTYLALAIVLAEALAIPLDIGIEVLRLPAPLGGLIVATLVLTPEAISAVRAALKNRLQRAVNISMGSVLATIGLTVPCVLTISLIVGKPVELGLSAADGLLLGLTLVSAILTFSGNRTNVLQGVVHLILFLAYLMLIVAP